MNKSFCRPSSVYKSSSVHDAININVRKTTNISPYNASFLSTTESRDLRCFSLFGRCCCLVLSCWSPYLIAENRNEEFIHLVWAGVVVFQFVYVGSAFPLLFHYPTKMSSNTAPTEQRRLRAIYDAFEGAYSSMWEMEREAEMDRERREERDGSGRQPVARLTEPIGTREEQNGGGDCHIDLLFSQKVR